MMTRHRAGGRVRTGQLDEVAVAVARETDWHELARVVMWYSRGDRSQAQFARLAGYGSNIASAWESRRRAPSARRLLTIAEALGVDVIGVMADFAPALALQLRDRTAATLEIGSWLDGLRGDVSVSSLARACELSKHKVGRCLRGTVSPKLADFMLLVQVTTGRAYELMSQLIANTLPPQLCDLRARRRAMWRQAG